jgi:hypothetical protein
VPHCQPSCGLYKFPGPELAGVGFVGSVVGFQKFAAPFCEHAFELCGLTQFVRIWFEVPGVGVCRCGDAGNKHGAWR